MSVDSPTRWKTSMCSSSGVITNPKPARLAWAAKRATSASHRSDCGGSTSAIPLGARGAATSATAERLTATAGHDAIGVVHGVDGLDRADDGVEVVRVGELEIEPHL